MGGNKRKKKRTNNHDNKNRNSNNNNKRKRQRKNPKQRFWIEDCQDTKTSISLSEINDKIELGKEVEEDVQPEEMDEVLELLVTRAELTDDYRQIPKDIKDTGSKHSVLAAKDEGDKESQNLVFDTEIAPIFQLKRISLKKPVEGETEKGTISANEPTRITPKITIRRARNAKKPIEKQLGYVKDFTPLPNGDCGDGILNPFPKEEVPDKYWSQRLRLFSRFDEGIKLDKESWYSVTPEAIANHIASHLVGTMSQAVVLDPFCGCGGNAIAFALRPEVKRVLCVDRDEAKLKKAYWNARIYGVEEKLLLVCGDALDVLSRYVEGSLCEDESNDVTKDEGAVLPKHIDTIFLSPPWGGVNYGNVGKHGYDLTCIKIDDVESKNQKDGEWLLRCATRAIGQQTIAYFLPKNINGIAFAKSASVAGYTAPIVMEQNILNGKLKTVTAYLGLGAN